MMHQKAILFNDEESASKILQTDDPKTCQELGRQVKNYNASIWNENKLNIVTEGSYHKFAHSTLQNDDLKSKLLATGNRPLVEASPVDRVWGVGFGAQDAEDNRAEWGENLLGIALEAARQRIRTESRPAIEPNRVGQRQQLEG